MKNFVIYPHVILGSMRCNNRSMDLDGRPALRDHPPPRWEVGRVGGSGCGGGVYLSAFDETVYS